MTDHPDFPTSSLISVNGVELEVFEAGRREGAEPIVLCHGWPELAYSWRYQIPVLVDAGYHVIVPNQRGYGRSSCPVEVTAYDIEHLTGDLVGLLDHYGYETATFVGHDWGSMVVWGLSLLHPTRVNGTINLSVPYQERGAQPWVEALEAFLGENSHLVHFNRKPGVADAVLSENTPQFLRNLFRKNVPPVPPEPGMPMIQLATSKTAAGEPVMSEEELSVFVRAFETTGFTPSINWYRNLDRNWHLLGEANPVIETPVLMIYGDKDLFVQQFDRLADFLPNVEVVNLDCGHWMQQELPQETNRTMLEWLRRHHSHA